MLAEGESSSGLPSGWYFIESISPLSPYPLFESINVAEGVLLLGGGIVELVLMSALDLGHWTDV